MQRVQLGEHLPHVQGELGGENPRRRGEGEVAGLGAALAVHRPEVTGNG